MTPQQAETFKYSVLDLTKGKCQNTLVPLTTYSLVFYSDWDPKDVPRQEVGRIVLTQNPYASLNLPVLSDISDAFFISQNYFAEIEQAAFAPGHMVHTLFSTHSTPS